MNYIGAPTTLQCIDFYFSQQQAPHLIWESHYTCHTTIHDKYVFKTSIDFL
jgi:hypothetical protein